MTILQRFAALVADAVGLATAPKSRVSLRYEPANLSSSATASSIQSALRAAEGGNTRDLFAIYRDILVTGSHVHAEFSKRKLAMLAQPHSIMPVDEDDPADVKAADAVRQMIAGVENWNSGLTYLLDSVLYPVSVVEKIFAPADDTVQGTVPLRYKLKRLEPVNYTLLCFQQPYVIQPGLKLPSPVSSEWEQDLRFYQTVDGRIDYNYLNSYPAERDRHVVHRGHMLAGVRDNWGGPMRSILFWWFLTPLLRDWWAKSSERYGSPFVVGHTDVTNQEAVTLLESAFSSSVKIGGLVVDHDTQVELVEAATSGMAENFERFLSICNREISKVLVGQTLSGEAQSTGLGSGTSKLQSDVREDYRAWDQVCLGETLRSQCFSQFLRVNGIRGKPPTIAWGGLSDEDAAEVAGTLSTLSQAGLEPTDEALETLQKRIGFALQRKAPVALPGVGGPASGGSPGQEGGAEDDTEDDTDEEDRIETLRAPEPAILRGSNPVDKIAQARAKALGDAYRGAMAPFRQIILESASREECLARLKAAYADWTPDRLTVEMETALQISAAAGAAAASADSR